MNKTTLCLIIVFFLNSCGVKPPPLTNNDLPKNAKDLVKKIISQNNDYEGISLQGKIEVLKQNEKINLKTKIKYKRDSLIWASFSLPIGVELFRVVLNQEKIYFLNHTNKTAFIKPTLEFSEILKTEMSFDQICKVITATPRILTNDKYEFGFDEFFFELKSKNVFYKISKDFYRITNIKVSKEGKTFSCKYSSFIETEKGVFPKKLSIKINSSEKIEVNLEYSKITFNKNQKTPFNIPDSYALEIH